MIIFRTTGEISEKDYADYLKFLNKSTILSSFNPFALSATCVFSLAIGLIFYGILFILIVKKVPYNIMINIDILVISIILFTMIALALAIVSWAKVGVNDINGHSANSHRSSFLMIFIVLWSIIGINILGIFLYFLISELNYSEENQGPINIIKYAIIIIAGLIPLAIYSTVIYANLNSDIKIIEKNNEYAVNYYKLNENQETIELIKSIVKKYNNSTEFI